MVRTLCFCSWFLKHALYSVRKKRRMSDKKRIVGTTGGAVGLSAFALALGACCVLPWAVSLLGIAGAVALARLTFLQPYVLLGTAGLLGLAFWFAYRSKPVCADGICEVSSQRAMRSVVWVAAAVTVVLVAASYAPRFLT
jgi:hypothetical protein